MKHTIKHQIQSSLLDKADREELDMKKEMAKEFATQWIQPILSNDLPDGKLEMVTEIINQAFLYGLATSPVSSMPGYDYGIWGIITKEQGCLSSIVLLNELAKQCGGIALNLHAQGVTSFILSQFGHVSKKEHINVALAMTGQEGLPNAETLFSNGNIDKFKADTTAIKSLDGYELNGRKMFVPCTDKIDQLLVIAWAEKYWKCFVVDAQAQGVKIEETGARTGLRACRMINIQFNKVIVRDALDEHNPGVIAKQAFFLNCIGLSSIALGIAEGAIEAAQTYAGERIQGGKTIEKHMSVKLLLAEAHVRSEAASAMVYNFNKLDSGRFSIKNAAVTKLIVMESAVIAVTNALQVFGGYGYVHDFRMEKRLRDIKTLQSMMGSSRYLKHFIMDIEKE